MNMQPVTNQPQSMPQPMSQPMSQPMPQLMLQPMAQPMLQPPAQTSNVNTLNNTVVVGQTGSGNSLLLIGRDKLQSRKWNSGLFSCLNDCTSCIFGTICLPMLLCRISNRLGECALVTCCVPSGFATLRTKIRTMGGIRGSICKDCVLTVCCPHCVACQISRELDVMGL